MRNLIFLDPAVKPLSCFGIFAFVEHGGGSGRTARSSPALISRSSLQVLLGGVRRFWRIHIEKRP